MYNAKKKKSVFTRLITLMMTVLTMALVLSFVPMAANAAEVPAADTAAVVEELPSIISDADFITMEVDAPVVKATAVSAPIVNAAAITPPIHKLEAETTYSTVVNFFVTWFRRIGALVAFVGAVMFALAIKNNDAEQKQNGLMTLVAGFALVAICTGVDMFDLFS